MYRRKIIVGSLLSALTIFFAFIIFRHLVITDPPEEWWAEQVTIEQVESAHEKRIEYQISRAKDVGIMVYDEDTSGLKMASPEELKKYIDVLKSQRKLNSPGWNKLKSLHRKGDAIHRYAAPPLGGPFGYILVRNSKVVYKHEVGIQ